MSQKIKRNRIDTCNICKEIKTMTWDHVPPKGGINLSSVEMESLFLTLVGKADNSKSISQNGVKYRTICGDCNSKIGSEFDPVLNQFNRDIITILQSKLYIPRYVSVKVKPIRLIKAVLAHILSAKINTYDNVFDKEVRSLILYPEVKITESIHIFYWIYPYDRTIIMRDFVLLEEPKPVFCNMIKYFPIAFLITNSNNFRGLDSLSKYRYCELDQEVDLKIDLGFRTEPNWPERNNDSDAIFMSSESLNGMFAKPKRH